MHVINFHPLFFSGELTCKQHRIQVRAFRHISLSSVHSFLLRLSTNLVWLYARVVILFSSSFQGLVTPINISELGHSDIDLLLVQIQIISLSNACLLLRNAFQWIIQMNNSSFDTVCKISAILFHPQCVKNIFLPDVAYLSEPLQVTRAHWPALRAGLLCCNFFGQPGSVSKFPPFVWVKLWVGWVGRGYTEISRYFPASWINWVTLVTKIKLLYSLRF